MTGWFGTVAQVVGTLVIASWSLMLVWVGYVGWQEWRHRR